MTGQILTEREAAAELEAAAEWYEKKRPGLGLEFLEEAVTQPATLET